MSPLRLLLILQVTSGFALAVSESFSGYWKGEKLVASQDKGDSKIIQATFFEADTNHTATLRSLPIFVDGRDTSYSNSDGPLIVESGTTLVVGDTLIFEIARASAGSGGPTKHSPNRIFKIRNGAIIEIGSNRKLTRLKREEYYQFLKKWGIERGNGSSREKR